jgi:FkbM family methyltransferase
MVQFFPALKQLAISTGGYKPARWLLDHCANRDRLRYRHEIAALLSTIVKPDHLCFDVGANIGDYSEALLSLGARVVSIDPQPSAIRELRARFRGNPRIAIEPVGLSGAKREAEFFIRRHHGASGLNAALGETPDHQITVQLVTLDEIIRRHGSPHYVKIDVEGHELEVLKGLSGCVPFLSVEYHLTKEDLSQKFAILDLLGERSRVTCNVLPEGQGRFMWPDFIDTRTFRQRFPSSLREGEEPFYGDIFFCCSERTY